MQLNSYTNVTMFKSKHELFIYWLISCSPVAEIWVYGVYPTPPPFRADSIHVPDHSPSLALFFHPRVSFVSSSLGKNTPNMFGLALSIRQWGLWLPVLSLYIKVNSLDISFVFRFYSVSNTSVDSAQVALCASHSLFLSAAWHFLGNLFISLGVDPWIPSPISLPQSCSSEQLLGPVGAPEKILDPGVAECWISLSPDCSLDSHCVEGQFSLSLVQLDVGQWMWMKSFLVQTCIALLRGDIYLFVPWVSPYVNSYS